MASAQTYTPIATTTLASNTASYTFSSIPQTYTDLILEATGATDYTAGTSWPFYIQVGNGLVDIGSNYSDTMLYGNGSSALAHRDSGNTVLYFGEFPANTGGTNRFEL